MKDSLIDLPFSMNSVTNRRAPIPPAPIVSSSRASQPTSQMRIAHTTQLKHRIVAKRVANADHSQGTAIGNAQ